MNKQAISVTLERDNLTWVRGRALASGGLSVSEMLDRLIAYARAGGAGRGPGGTSVVGTVEVAPDDPELLTADAAIRTLLAQSVARSARAMGRAGARGAGQRRVAGTGKARA
jgi:hypothetical protein